MAQYTMTIKEITDSNINIFDTERKYPIFNESYRSVLESFIKEHYYFREIGSETVGQFIYRLNAKMRLIMPYYNKLYSAMNLEQRILDNYDVTETFTRDANGTQGENGTTSNIEKFSDSPQSRVNLSESTFLTNLTDNAVTVDNDIVNTNHETWVRTMKGNIGIQTDADAVNKYIDSIKNIDEMIIEELNELFMGVY